MKICFPDQDSIFAIYHWLTRLVTFTNTVCVRQYSMYYVQYKTTCMLVFISFETNNDYIDC